GGEARAAAEIGSRRQPAQQTRGVRRVQIRSRVRGRVGELHAAVRVGRARGSEGVRPMESVMRSSAFSRSSRSALVVAGLLLIPFGCGGSDNSGDQTQGDSSVSGDTNTGGDGVVADGGGDTTKTDGTTTDSTKTGDTAKTDGTPVDSPADIIPPT